MNAIDTPVVGVEVEGRAFALHAPARPEVEVRAAVARSESHCGYGAALWPMARVLAAHVLRSPIVGPGLRVLEIGCGLGLVSLAAAARGCDVTATDASEAALARVRASAALNGLTIRTRPVDWRDPPPTDLAADLILGADVIYDLADHEPVARLIAAGGGPAILADPARPNAIGFEQALARHGLRAWQTPIPGGRMLFVQRDDGR